MSFIHSIDCSLTGAFYSNNQLVNFAEKVATPCKWLFGTKDITLLSYKEFTYSALSEKYLKIALGIILVVPAAIVNLLCMQLAMSYDKEFAKRFSKALEVIAYDKICSMAPQPRYNSVFGIELVFHHHVENYSNLTWFEKAQSYCWISSLPQHLRDLLNTRSMTKQAMLNWYKEALDRAKCDNNGPGLNSLYHCMPPDIFKEFFDKNLISFLSDVDNVNKSKPYYEPPSREEQAEWLSKLLESSYENEEKREFLKGKLEEELKSSSDLIDIIRAMPDPDLYPKTSTFYLSLNYYFKDYFTNNLPAILPFCKSEFGEWAVKQIPYDYEKLKEFLEPLSKIDRQFIFSYASLEPYFYEVETSHGSEIRRVSVSDCIFEILLNNENNLSDIFGDTLKLYCLMALWKDNKHTNRIPEVIQILRNENKVVGFVFDSLITTNDKNMHYKLLRCLNDLERFAIQERLNNLIKDLQEESQTINNKYINNKNSTKISKQDEFRLDIIESDSKLHKNRLELFENLFPSLFDIILQSKKITQQQLNLLPLDIQDKIRSVLPYSSLKRGVNLWALEELTEREQKETSKIQEIA